MKCYGIGSESVYYVICDYERLKIGTGQVLCAHAAHAIPLMLVLFFRFYFFFSIFHCYDDKYTPSSLSIVIQFSSLSSPQEIFVRSGTVWLVYRESGFSYTCILFLIYFQVVSSSSSSSSVDAAHENRCIASTG